MDKIYVSIIIPAHNAEATISETIVSALNQTLKEIEVIVIDDGSTDQTVAICQQFCKDDRFRIICKDNGGVSFARNQGIRAARGEYIGFIDSDDTVAKNMYERMYTAGKRNEADVCICDINRVRDASIQHYTDIVRGGVFSKAQIEQEIFPIQLGCIDEMGEIIRIDWCVLRRIYRNEFLKKNNIWFNERLSNSEDCLFVFQTTVCATRITYLKNEFLYNNINNANSLTKHYLPDYWEQRKRLINEVYTHSMDQMSAVRPDMMSLFIFRCVRASFINIALGFNTNGKIESYLAFRRIIFDEQVAIAVKNLPKYHYSFEWTRHIGWIKNRKVWAVYSYYMDVYGCSKLHHNMRKLIKALSRIIGKW